MSSTWLAGLAFCCAAVPAVLWVWNMLLYREPGAGSCAEMGHCVLPDAISVLIPARNEERVIAASLTSLLASRGVQIEIIVLDDASTDRTAEIVLSFAAKDPRVRLESSPPLPRGWNGKQHACHALAAKAAPTSSVFLTQMCVWLPKPWSVCPRSWRAPAPIWSAAFPFRRRRLHWSGYCCR